MSEVIKCPKCGAEIELTGALRKQLVSEVTEEFETQKQVLIQQAKNIEIQQQNIDGQVAEQLKSERKKIVEQERAKILAAQTMQTEALEQELKEKRQQLVNANKKELELRKQQQTLEDEKAAFELTVQRKLDEERKTIVEQASERAVEQQQLKIREKDDQLESLAKQITELKRRVEVGSQQAAGEVLEEVLQDSLQQAFPLDNFEEVKKGQRGADIVQRVRNNNGNLCGSILWESKNTKEFSSGWVSKLREDQQRAKADIAVIVSIALPKDIKGFGRQDDIWISDFKLATGLAVVLRHLLIEIVRQKLVSAGRTTMRDLVYEYVTGTEFAMHIKTVAAAFSMMQGDLEKEKRAVVLIWKKREKQLSTVLTNLAGMKGSIEGLVQKALPEPENFSLEEIAADKE